MDRKSADGIRPDRTARDGDNIVQDVLITRMASEKFSDSASVDDDAVFRNDAAAVGNAAVNGAGDVAVVQSDRVFPDGNGVSGSLRTAAVNVDGFVGSVDDNMVPDGASALGIPAVHCAGVLGI